MSTIAFTPPARDTLQVASRRDGLAIDFGMALRTWGHSTTAKGPHPTAAAQKEPVSAAALSAQELKVLVLCTKGLSHKEIASLLELSIHTIETYFKRIYRKLAVHSKCEAIYEARQLGLVKD